MKNLSKILAGTAGAASIVASMPEEAGAELKIVRMMNTAGKWVTRSVQMNPTWNELKTQFDESSYKALRAISWTDDAGKSHLATWDAASGMHHQMKKALGANKWEAQHLFVGGDMDSMYNLVNLKAFGKRCGVPGTPAAIGVAGLAGPEDGPDFKSLYSPEAAEIARPGRVRTATAEEDALEDSPLDPASLIGDAVSAVVTGGASIPIRAGVAALGNIGASGVAEAMSNAEPALGRRVQTDKKQFDQENIRDITM